MEDLTETEKIGRSLRKINERKIMENDKSLALAAKNEVAIASASAMAVAEIRSSMQLAKMYPRDDNHARVKILDTCRRPGFAPHVCYGKPIGGKVIKGISIRGAEVAANYWCNIKSMSGIVYDDENKRIINVVSMDLETNTSYSSQVVVDKIIERKYLKKGQIKIYERKNSKDEMVYGVTPTGDEFEVKVAAHVSKQIRNNILRIIPEDIKEEMVIVANETMKDKAAEDPQGEIKKIVDAFASLRIMPKDLRSYLGHDVGKCSPTQVAELRVMYKSIKDGEGVWSDYLPQQQQETSKETDQTKTDRVKAEMAEKIKAEKNDSAPTTETKEEVVECGICDIHGDFEGSLNCPECLAEMEKDMKGTEPDPEPTTPEEEKKKRTRRTKIEMKVDRIIHSMVGLTEEAKREIEQGTEIHNNLLSSIDKKNSLLALEMDVLEKVESSIIGYWESN